MPNWMKCRLTISNTDFESFVKTYVRRLNEDDLLFDFNLIDEMPKDLEIPKGSMERDGLRLAATKRCNFCNFYGQKEDKLSIVDFRKWLIKIYGENAIDSISNILLTNEEYGVLAKKYNENNQFKEIEKLGEQCVSNILKYGYKDWYDWALDHWGVKWNAHHSEVDLKAKYIQWNSPWTYPQNVLLTLSKIYPTIELKLDFAEERVGYIAGEIIIQNGNLKSEHMYPSYSQEAYDVYNRLWN